MSRNRTAAALVAWSLLVGGLPATASAEPVNPLYRLVDTAAQRLATADPVAATKWINNGPPIDDPPRAAAVLDAVAADATAHGIDSNYVRSVFTDQIGAAEMVRMNEVGFAGTTVSFVNFKDELPFFIDRVLPLLQEAGLRSAPGQGAVPLAAEQRRTASPARAAVGG